MPNRTIRALLAAMGTALLLWFVAGVVRRSADRIGLPYAVSDLLAPAAHVELVLHGASSLGLDDALAAVVLLGVLAALALPALRATRTGTAARVLAVWFATIVAGWAAGVAALLTSEDVRRVLAYGIREAGMPMLALGWFEPARTGWGWGVAYGWVVGLVAVAVARRGTHAEPIPRPAGAFAAALVAGAVSTLGWIAVAAAHLRIVDLVQNRTITPDRAELAAWVRIGADWVLPVTTSALDSNAVVVLSGVTVGIVVGTLVWFAARTTVLAGGRLVLFLGVWAAAMVGAVLGALPSTLSAGDANWASELPFRHTTDGGAAGALYGWIPAALVLAVLAVARSVAPRSQEASVRAAEYSRFGPPEVLHAAAARSGTSSSTSA